MESQLIANEEAQETLLRLAQRAASMHWAVAWATDNAVAGAARRHADKLDCLVIGTHFYQTSPDFLRRFEGVAGAKVHPPTGPLFHPKLYCFETKEQAWALVGSHNLTHSAMAGGNTEVSVLLTGTPQDTLFRSLKAFVRQEWNKAKRIDQDFLFAYGEQYKAKRPDRESLGRFIHMKLPRNDQRAPNQLSWPEFLASVRKDRGLGDRLDVLQAANGFFRKDASFAEMALMKRKAIAGTVGQKQKVPGDPDWSWFGTMRASGSFARLVMHNPAGLSRALDNVPLTGPVSEAQYDRFCQEFVAAFQGESRKGGVATATRLLALKRPDVFTGVNDENKRRLCDALGTAPTTLSLDNYWERVTLRVHDAPFWRSPRPRSPEAAAIWDSRAALLDSIYYDGPGPNGTS